MSRILLDGATIFDCANLSRCIADNRKIRPVDLLSLNSLIDAYVLFDEIWVESSSWAYFRKWGNTSWAKYLNKHIKPKIINRINKSSDLNKFLYNPLFFLIPNYIGGEITSIIRNFNFAYVDHIMGSVQESKFKIKRTIKKRIDELISSTILENTIGHFPLNTDLILAYWRGIKYSEFCSEKDVTYYPHEFRGSFLEIYAYAKGIELPENNYVFKIINEARETIFRKRWDQILSGSKLIHGNLSDNRRSLDIFKLFKMPVLSAYIYQKANDINEIFYYANELRENAKSLRTKCAEIDIAQKYGIEHKVNVTVNEFLSFFKRIDEEDSLPKVNMSFTFSFPWGLALNIDYPHLKNKMHLNFVRDIMSSIYIPYTLERDIYKVFGRRFFDFFS